jgi:hypothetical protein
MPNIEIIVREGKTASGASASQESTAKSAGETAKDQDKEEGKPSAAQQALIAGIINVAKTQAINGINQYGNITGNYVATQSINNAIEMVTDIAAVMKGGPVGLVYVLSKHTLNLINSGISQMNATREQDFRNELLGKVSVEGSRY